jgi:hypothetical protein
VLAEAPPLLDSLAPLVALEPPPDSDDAALLAAALLAALLAALVALLAGVDALVDVCWPGELPHAAKTMADAAMRAVVATTRVLIIDCPPRGTVHETCHQAPVDRWHVRSS